MPVQPLVNTRDMYNTYAIPSYLRGDALAKLLVWPRHSNFMSN